MHGASPHRAYWLMVEPYNRPQINKIICNFQTLTRTIRDTNRSLGQRPLWIYFREVGRDASLRRWNLIWDLDENDGGKSLGNGNINQSILEIGELFVFIRDKRTVVEWSGELLWQEGGLEPRAVSSFPFVLNPATNRLEIVANRGKCIPGPILLCRWVKEEETEECHWTICSSPGERWLWHNPGGGYKIKPGGISMASCPSHPIGQQETLGPGSADQRACPVHSLLTEHHTYLPPALTSGIHS